MGDVTTIGLGFQGNNANRFESSILGQAPGSAAFYACVLVHVRESLLVAPTEAAYFGNFNNVDAGWELGRTFDTPASDPPNSPEIVTFRVRLGAGGITEEIFYSMDASTIFGRTHMLAVSVIGLVATLYLNGTAVAALTLGAPLALGASRLTYGNRSGGGARSGDPIVAAAYSDTDAADFILNQRILFDRIRSGGNLASSIPALALEAAYIYEGFSQKAPNSGVPTLPLTNFGVAGVIGNLTFVGSTALNVNIDLDPDYTGGAQSTTGGPGGLNLQDAYNAGPTGLIVTGGPGPFGVDDIRIANNEIFTLDSAAAIPDLEINGGANTAGGTGGNVDITSGASAGVGGGGGNVVVAAGAGELIGGSVLVDAGEGTNLVNGQGGDVFVNAGDGHGVSVGGVVVVHAGDHTGLGGQGGQAELTGGNSTGAIGGNTLVAGGTGGVDAPNGFVGGSVLVTGGPGGVATAGGTAGNGGQLIASSGNGGDATGAGATAGNGGELNLTAGAGGDALVGATPGVGGLLFLSGGNGEDGTGGAVLLTSGAGDLASGNIDITVGVSPGVVGLLSILGGPAIGIGSGPGGNVVVTGGPAANGEGQNGGSVDITGGLGDGPTGSGGAARLTGGTTGVGGGPGGNATVIGGDGGGGAADNGGFGGTAIVSGGNSTQANQPAGEAQLEGGDATGAGAPAFGGHVQIRGGSSVSSDGGFVALSSGSGVTTTDAGALGASFGGGGLGTPTSTDGGWYLDPTNGRFSLRNYTIGGTPTGSLKVHELNTAGEALQSPAQQGLIHFQTEQAAGVATTVGFRASKSGNYGLVARVYQEAISGAGPFVLVHNLDCNAPLAVVYDAAGTVVVPLTVTQNSLDQITVTVAATVGASGFITVVGI
jgi:hypothetical protein